MYNQNMPPAEGDWWFPDSTGQDTNYSIYMTFTCPKCNAWIYNYTGYSYCPYCGHELASVVAELDGDMTLLKQIEVDVEKIMLTLEEIKKTLIDKEKKDAS